MKKRALSLLMALVMVIGLLPATIRAAGGTLEGKGTEKQPYLISNAAELKAFRDLVNGGESPVCAKLTADIDLGGEEWTPITSLTGYLDGDGYTISNLTLKGGNGNTGLIGELSGSVINLSLDNVSVEGNATSSGSSIGSLVGKIKEGSESKIDNCYVSGTVSNTGSGYVYIGGLVGMMTGETDAHTVLTINNCVSDVALTCARSNYIGGLLGTAQYYSDVTITKCAQLGEISGYGTGSGLIGYISSSSPTLTLENSYVGSKVGSSTKYIIAYNFAAPSKVTCTDFYWNGSHYSSYNAPYLIKSGENLFTNGTTKSTTGDLKSLTMDGFAVRDGEFDGYPVPAYTKAEPLPLPKVTVSVTVKFTGTDNGTVEVKDPSGAAVQPGEDGSYTLTELGEYSYTVTGMAQYKDVTGSFEIRKGDDGNTKTIAVAHEYKDVDLTGAGTQEEPIQISTALELRTFAAKVNNGELSDAWVRLENDIVVPGSWTPLGKSAATPFRGQFDGQGHSVTVTVDDPGLSYYGFFGCLDSGADRDSTTPIEDQPTVTVKNLTVKGTIYCSEPYAYVGGTAGRARGKVSIESCVNSATISSLARGSAGVGGLIGGYDDGVDYAYKSICMTVDGCENNGLINVTGSNPNAMVGGLVGSNANCVQVKNSTNRGTVNAPGCTVGGLLGQAGYQTGDYKPSISDSANTGTLIGAEGRTNNLYGKGTLPNVTGSGDNTYAGGTASGDELLAESLKYSDVLAVPSGALVGDEVMLLKDGETAAQGITVTCSQGEKDTNKEYLKVENGVLKLAKRNTTGKVIEATATITWSKDGKSLSKPVTVNLYPASTGEISAHKSLMEKIAATYAGSSGDWVVFDMAAYAKCGFGDNTTDTQNYLNLTVNELAGTSPLVTDRAKGEIILAALGVDSTKLTTVDGLSYSNAEKLAGMNLGSSHYAAPWVLLAEQAGQVKLNDAQRDRMIALLTDSGNLNADGIFTSTWAGETYADPDTTGTALAALARYNTNEYPKVQKFVTKAVEGLSKAQGSNGSYGNVSSDAMVIIGLAAAGIDPAGDSRFVKGGCSLADALLLYVNDGGNGFTAGYASGAQGEKAKALATEQGFRALITLEKYAALSGTEKSFNIYTRTAKVSQNGNTTVTAPNKPTLGFNSDKAGTPEDSTSGGGSSGGAESRNVTVRVTIRSDETEWVAGSYTVAEGKSAFDALKKAMDDNGIDYQGDGSYIKSLTRDGVTLGQMDKGPNSGWMYQINGRMALVSLEDYVLKTGDQILFYYVLDYTKEDTGTDFGGGGGGGTAQPEQPAALAPAAAVRDGTASVSVSAGDLNAALGAAKKSGEDAVTITPEIKGEADSLAVTLPAAAAADAAKQGVRLVVETDKAQVSLSAELLGELAKNSGSELKLEIRAKKPADLADALTEEKLDGASIVEVTLSVGGKTITSFGGRTLSICIPVDKKLFRAGEACRVLILSDDGTVERTSGTCVEKDGALTVTVETAHLSTFVIARAAALPFADVADTAWYADAVRYAYENGLMTGVSEKEFAPNGTATRAQIVTLLWRLAGKPVVNYAMRYADVSEGAWYGEAVRWAASAGIVTGYTESRFAPNDAITREQLAAVLYRYAKSQGQGFSGMWYFPLRYDDAPSISAWADEAMHWCVMKGILNGTSETTLGPKDTATRAQLAAILQRFCALPEETVRKSAAQTAYDGVSAYLTEAVSAPRYGGLGGEWTVLALARGGADTETAYFTDYYTALEQTVRENSGVLSERRHTEYSRVILALSALGRDARSVAGYDLTLPLGDLEKTSAQGVNGMIYALLALDSRGYPMPQNAAAGTQATRQMYADAILAAQLSNGGWSFAGADADPDLTAMALQALARYQGQSAVKAAVNRALVCLSELQNADGGFSSWGTENAESCAQVLLALDALGLDAEDSRFVKNGKSVLDALLTYQTADGGFCHERGGETNLMASEQAACALASLVRAECGESGFYQMAAPAPASAA